MVTQLSELRCPICGEALAGGDDVENLAVCERCKTPHHESCWSYGGGCAVYGCGGRTYERRGSLVAMGDGDVLIPLSSGRQGLGWQLLLGTAIGVFSALFVILLGALGLPLGAMLHGHGTLVLTMALAAVWIAAGRRGHGRLRLGRRETVARRERSLFGKLLGRATPLFRRDEVLAVAIRRTPSLGSGFTTRLEVVLRDGRCLSLHERYELLLGGDAAILAWAEKLAAWAGVDRVLVDETRPEIADDEGARGGPVRIRLPLNMLQQFLPNLGYSVFAGILLGVISWMGFSMGSSAAALPLLVVAGLLAWAGASFHRVLVRHRIEGGEEGRPFRLRPLLLGIPLPAWNWFAPKDVREVQLLQMVDAANSIEALQIRLDGGRWLTVGLSTSTDPYPGGLMGPARTLARACGLCLHLRDDPGAIHAYRPFVVGPEDGEGEDEDEDSEGAGVPVRGSSGGRGPGDEDRDEILRGKFAPRGGSCVLCGGGTGRRAWCCHACGAVHHRRCWDETGRCASCGGDVVHLPPAAAGDPFALFGLPCRPVARWLAAAAIAGSAAASWGVLAGGAGWVPVLVLAPLLCLLPLAVLDRKLFLPKDDRIHRRFLLFGRELGARRPWLRRQDVEAVELRVPAHGRFQELWIRERGGAQRRLGTFVNLPCRGVDWVAEAVARFVGCTVRRLDEGEPGAGPPARRIAGPGHDGTTRPALSAPGEASGRDRPRSS